jgi:hypothetical protein
MDMKRLEKLKKAVSNGTYAVRAEELAPKLMQYMLQASIFHETSIEASTSRLEPEGQLKAIAQPRRGARRDGR